MQQFHILMHNRLEVEIKWLLILTKTTFFGCNFLGKLGYDVASQRIAHFFSNVKLLCNLSILFIT